MKWISENALTLIGSLLSIISIAIALYQYKDKKKFQYLIKTNAWILFQRINNLGGTIQKTLIDANNYDINKDLYEKIVRSDTLAAELYKEGIRLIMISEENITAESIDMWEHEGKISNDYSKLFKTYLSNKN